jgi:hypothetical protein
MQLATQVHTAGTEVLAANGHALRISCFDIDESLVRPRGLQSFIVGASPSDNGSIGLEAEAVPEASGDVQKALVWKWHSALTFRSVTPGSH